MNKLRKLPPARGKLSVLVKQAGIALGKNNFAEAETLYKEILHKNPQSAVAWDGLARVAIEAGHHDLAIGFAGKALSLDPSAEHHLRVGQALFLQGHYEEARAALHVACLLNPASSEASFYHAQSLAALKRDDESEKIYRHILVQAPRQVSYFVAFARFLLDRGRVVEAAQYWEEAAMLAVHDVQIQHEFAMVLSAMGRVEQAADIFAHVARLVPDDPAAHANKGAALFSAHRFEEAKIALQTALDLKAESAEALSNMGLVLMALGELGGALEIFEQALRLRPGDEKISLNLATILTDLREYERAKTIYKHLIKTSSDKSLCDQARFNLSTIMLAQGHLEEGWTLFEARKALVEPGNMALLPSWKGEDISGPLLIQAEQGLGDFIHFLRYLPYASQQADLIVEVPPPLLKLVSNSQVLAKMLKRTCRFIETATYQGGAVARTTLLSLPSLLKLYDKVSFQPYLDTIISYASQKRSSEAKKSVGLVWSGNPSYRFDRRRSIAFDQLWPFFEDVKDVSWFNLQPAHAKMTLPEFILPLEEGADMAQTAAIIMQLDLVIAVDTAVAHLAGAMGKPVWLLNRYGGDWRWSSFFQNSEKKSLWYSSMKIYTQSEPLSPVNAWNNVLQEVKEQLIQWVEQDR